MPRILLADDSPHAQRMGERILRDEGFEVVTVTDGETALIRLADADPDVVLVDVMLPRRNGYHVCEHIRKTPFHSHTKVILTHGMLAPFSQAEADRVGSDAVLMKPFEASAVIALVKPMANAAAEARASRVVETSKPVVPAPVEALPVEAPLPVVETPPVAVPDPIAEVPAIPTPPLDLATAEPDLVRAAVILAVDAAMPALVEEITKQVLTALKASTAK